MKNAGLEILRYHEVFNKKEYDYLMSLPKLEKNIVVGKFLKTNKEANEVLMETFIEIRKLFFEMNNLSDDDVLSIKKDAIFLINKFPTKLELNEFFKFVPKNTYDSYILINNREHYYNSENDILDVKGYPKEIKDKQKDFMFKFLKECMRLKLINNEKELFRKLIVFKDDFINNSLDKEYYRDLIEGNFIIKIFGVLYGRENIDESMIELCIKNNNLNFIIELINKIL